MSATVRVGVPAEVQEALGRLAALVGRDRHGSVTIGGVAIEPGDGSTRIADIIYGAWYTPDPSTGSAGVHPRQWRVDLVSVLRAAHARRFKDGWVVTASSPDGRCWLAKHGAARLATPGDYVNLTRPGVPPAPGEQVAVVSRVDWVDEPSGFWFTADPPSGPAPPLSRAYLNVRSDTVAPVLHLLTEALAQAGLAYTLKCPRDVDGYARTDAIVVYHERARAPEVQALLGPIAEELGALLQPSVPPLTRQLAPGLAFADDPGGGKSFGEHVCAALAPGLWAVAQAGATGEAAVATLLIALETAGVDPAKPWLDRTSATGGDA